ncbi:low molecular weight protein tyrosine phosphatase family protein [Brunnivagina elsteri]|uniref:Phosphotyrosine protein phosphatase n=1 Tax=Brunnivagina elsteri CCALA 953 TaxID=987040 RepID=A0A2A2TPS8_9CYAN|nr:low molecular weight protein tyrosine phosphatase family protein [Calothrix elsteri]PAX60479.1 phosphotyrosine protein phosphatase [Calothrix elsteri CCALA 953]
MKKLLFICSQNKLRSPTAEAIFSEYEDLEAESAGLNNDAEVAISIEAIKWADIIFVMEQVHRRKLSQKFQPFLKGKRVICLDIRDEYEYMDADLIQVLKSKVLPILGIY